MKMAMAVRVFYLSLLIWIGVVSGAHAALERLSDQELSAVEGQALFTSQYVGDGQSGNDNAGISFYRMNLNANVAFNMNINKLQMGCGGVNGVGACDIDISQVSMMGDNGSGGAGAAATSDFSLQNPYVELAIKNDSSPANREVVGFRIGAHQANGFMSMGTINTMSGFMNTNMSGTLTIKVCSLSANSDRTGCGFASFVEGTINGTFNQTTGVSGSRLSSITVNPLTAHVTVLGAAMTVNSIVNETLSNVHGIDVNSPDFYFSFQKQALNWQHLSDGTFPATGVETAQKGWWMGIPSVTMANLNTTTYIGAFEAIGGIFGYQPVINNPNLGQVQAVNCFGGRTFC